MPVQAPAKNGATNGANVLSVADAERRAVELLGPDEADDDEDVELESVSPEEPAPAAAQAGGPAEPGAAHAPAAQAPAARESARQFPPAGQPAGPGEAPAIAADPWTEVEDVQYVDEDTGETYVVRAPKTYAAKVKGGYARRSLMDRKLGAYSRNREWLDPLAEDGRLDRLSPYLQRLFQDGDMQNAMVEAFTRRDAGRPLRFADDVAAEAAAAGAAARAPQVQAPPQATGGDIEARLAAIQRENGYDDYTMEVVRNSLGAVTNQYQEQINAMRSQFEPFIAAQQQQTQQAQERQRQAAWINQQALAARAELAARWPDTYGGNPPAETWNRVENYARRAGLLDRYGMQPLTFVEAHNAMMRDDSTSYTAAPSTAAATIANIDRQARELANRAAQQTGGVVVNAGNAASTPAPKRKVQVPRFATDPRTGKQRPLTPIEIADFQRKQAG